MTEYRVTYSRPYVDPIDRVPMVDVMVEDIETHGSVFDGYVPIPSNDSDTVYRAVIDFVVDEGFTYTRGDSSWGDVFYVTE